MLYYRHRAGERVLGKKLRFRKGSWIVLLLATLVWFAPISSAQATNLLDNGTFDGSSGWTVSQDGGSGVLFNGALRFSYETGEVSQTVSVSSGQTLNVSFTVDNSQTNSIGQGVTPDTWTATLSSSPASSTVTRSVAHDPETFSLSITIPEGATTATMAFSGMDNGYWAGHYGPIITNVTLSATPAPLPYTPANNGCGPYQAFSVTGTSGGAIWGSNPYTDDSTFSSAAVHAGLISVGETAIIEPYLVDNYPSYAGSTANGVSTYTWGSSWCGYYIRILGTGEETPTTTTTTTTLPPYFNAVENLTATANEDGSVDLDWDAPTASNTEIYAYGVMFYGLDEIGGNILNGWGVWTGQGTNYSLADYMFSATTGFGPVRFGIKAGNQSCFSAEGVGPCAYGPEVTIDINVLDPTPPTTTTTTTIPPTTTTTTTTTPEETTTTWPEQTTTTTTLTPVTTTSVDVPTTTVPVTSTAPPETTLVTVPVTETTTSAPVEETIPPETTVAEPETTVPESTPDTQPEPVPEQPTGDVTTEDLTDLSTTELAEQLDNLSTEELTTLVESIDEPDQLEALIDAGAVDQLDTDQLLSIIDNPVFTELSAEAFSEVLTSVLDEPLTDDQFDSVIDAVLGAPISNEQFDALVDALGSDSVSDEQVQSAVDAIIENGITEEFATSLATSPEVLSSIDGEAATEIFAELPVSDLTDEEAEQIVEAVQGANEEVRESFETEINIFGAGNFDIYVPVGSAVDVGTRRVIIAATTVVSILTVASPPSAPAAPSGSSGGSGGPSGSIGSESSSTNKRRRLPGGR